MTNVPRLRFAPSPTGYFHVGGARTALYNWLFAKAHGGVFILRIDDTDEARNRAEWTEGIQNALEWLDISFDEGPYFQSDRKARYNEVALELYETSNAYYCNCTREEIDSRAKDRGGKPGYDGYCRDRGLGPAEGRALRFRVPYEGITKVVDLVRGEVEFDNTSIDDFILVKGNGAALYVLANFADDVDMSISHVVRAEEHLPTTPKAVLLYGALGLIPPLFAHLPVLVNEKRQKLSKRRDRVAVEDYRDMGFLPEAMCNYLALLGWSPGDNREFMSREEMTELFEFSRVGHSPSFFDVVKMTHFNKHYIGEMNIDDFVGHAEKFLSKMPWWNGSEEQSTKLSKIAPLVKERIALLSEVPTMVGFLFQAPDYSVEDARGFDQGSLEILARASSCYESLATWRGEVLEEATRALSSDLGSSLRKIQAPIRLAITGSKIGPPLFESLELLGRDETLVRLSSAQQCEEV